MKIEKFQKFLPLPLYNVDLWSNNHSLNQHCARGGGLLLALMDVCITKNKMVLQNTKRRYVLKKSADIISMIVLLTKQRLLYDRLKWKTGSILAYNIYLSIYWYSSIKATTRILGRILKIHQSRKFYLLYYLFACRWRYKSFRSWPSGIRSCNDVQGSSYWLWPNQVCSSWSKDRYCLLEMSYYSFSCFFNLHLRDC